MTEYYLPDIPRLYTALAEWMACLIFILPFKKRFFTGRNRLSCGRCIWNTERISDFYRWGKTDFLDPLYDICGFSDGCFCFLLL